MENRHHSTLVAAIIPLIYLSGNWTSPVLGDATLIKSAAAEVYTSFVLLLFFFSQKSAGKYELTRNPTVFIAIIFFLYLSLSVLWAENKGFFVDAWLKWFSASLTFAFAISIAKTPKNIPAIIQTMVVSAVLVASIGLAQQYFDWNYLPQSAEPGSTFSNRNLAGHVIVICLPLTFFGFLREESSIREKAASLCAAAMLIAYAYHTHSDAVWLSITLEITFIGCYLAYLFLKKYKATQRLSIISTAILVISGVAFFLPINNLGSGVDIFYNKVQANFNDIAGSPYGFGSRLDLWSTSWSIFKDYPIFGVGLGNFYEVWSNGYVQHYNLLGTQRVHNDPLEIAIDLGFVGLVLFALLLVLVGRSGFRLLNHNDRQLRLISALILCSLAGSGLNSLTSFPLQLIAPLVSLALLSGLIVGADNFSSISLKLRHVRRLPMKLAGLSASAAVLAICLYLNFYWIRDIDNLSRQYNRGTQFTPWKASSTLTNPNTINLIRMAVAGNMKYDAYRQANSFVSTLLDIWPNEPFNLLLATETNLGLNRLSLAKVFAIKLKNEQPEYSLSAEHYLLNIYSRENNLSELNKIYLK